MDAYEYTERIITDFTDVIAELEECKREVEAQQLVHQATDQFFEFMEKRFQPDFPFGCLSIALKTPRGYC